MTKKGQIKEIISQAKYHDAIDGFTIFYRDLNQIVEVTLKEWLEISEIDSIPEHRIQKISKENKIIFERPSQ